MPKFQSLVCLRLAKPELAKRSSIQRRILRNFPRLLQKRHGYIATVQVGWNDI